MRFDRKIFFDNFRQFLARYDKRLTQERVDALKFLLTSFERDPKWSDVRHIAYALATITAETAWTFEPIQEYGSFSYFERRYGHQTRVGRGLGNDAPGEGAKFSGKGYVQLTGESNYEKLENTLRKEYPQLVQDYQRKTGRTFDLTDYPEQAKDPLLAFAIMTIGMFEGIYTGKAFRHYFTDTKTDYRNARKIINGLDHADMIAGYAQNIETILKSAILKNNASKTSAVVPAIFPAEKSNQLSASSLADDGNLSADLSNQSTLQNEQSLIDSAVEKTEIQTSTETAQITETKNEQSVHESAAIEQPAPQGIFAKLTGGISALFSGTLIYTVAEKFGGITISQTVLILIIVAIVLAFLGFLFWAALDAWKSSKRVEIEADAKTNVNKKDIVWK